ncbi:MAG: molybdopterin-dependent oxidoreductase [Desulfobacterales bacterium]|jgi:anaerobic selenocysteine-containing dehydrogenase
MGGRQTVTTLCKMCDHGCGLEVMVRDGRPEALKGSTAHPFNRGWLCAKGRAALDLFYSPNRLSSPLIRKGNKLVPSGWEEAFTFIAEKLFWLQDKYGPQTLAIYHGEGVGHQEIKYYMKRFANVYRTPNFCGVGSLCNAARTMGETLTFGNLTKPDIPNSSFLIIWGGNPYVSHEPYPPSDLAKFKKRGGKLVVVDPRKTETASKADIYLPIKPGQDENLVLNILHVIFCEGLWDKTFTQKWVPDFERFYQAVIEERFSPEKGAALTGISSDVVRQVAILYAKSKSAGIFTGNGLEHHNHGVNTTRLLAILKAVSGNLDIPGGDIFTPRPALKDITSPLPEPSAAPIGSAKYALFCQARREAHALSLPAAIIKEKPYPIKGMIIAGGNPSLEWPQSSLTREALQRLEFLLVIDIVRSPECRYADVVLPACTFLERDEHRVNVYQNLPHITLRRKVVDHPVHGLPDQMIWFKLAQHMGFGEFFPWKSCEEGIDYLLSESGITLQDLIANGGVHQYAERTFRKYEHNGFNTPSGKIEIYPQKLKDLGLDFSPIREEILKRRDEYDDFPLMLITGGNLLSYTHWQYRYIPKLHKMYPDPIFEIHPDTARLYKLSNNEIAEVNTSYGRIKLKSLITTRIQPGAIHVPQGWEEANVNELTGQEGFDPISGFPNLKSVRCNIRKL